MEIMTGLAVLALGTLAVFMYFKTRPPAPSPAVGLDLSKFSPVADAGMCARIVESGRAALSGGNGSASGSGGGAAPADENCLSDGDRYVYRARVGAGTSVVLLDQEFKVRGTNTTLTAR